MASTKTERKQQAIKFLKLLGIYDGFIQNFEQDDTVCMYEHYIGYWAFQYPEVMNRVKQFEAKYKCTVYAITHEYTEFGECFDFMFVSNYKQEWKTAVEEYEGDFAVYAYVWNKDDDFCSEFGTIVVRSRHGGITRIS